VLNASEEIAAVSAAVAAAAVAVSAWQYRRTVHRETFRVYADKYNSILKPEIYREWLEALNGDQAKWDRMRPTMIAYLNLVWEEQFLASDRTIPRHLWKLWRPEIRTVLCTEFARQVSKECQFHFPENLLC